MTEKEAHLQMCVDQYERGIEAFANAMGKRLCDCRRDEMERKDALIAELTEALDTIRRMPLGKLSHALAEKALAKAKEQT